MRKEDLVKSVRAMLPGFLPVENVSVGPSSTPGRRLLSINLPHGFVFQANQLQTYQHLYRQGDERGAEAEIRHFIDLGIVRAGGVLSRSHHSAEELIGAM
jgi:hypothetical protein